MSQERKFISVPMSPDLKAALDLLADADHRPTASYTRMVLEKHVEAQRRKNPALFERKPEEADVAG